MTLVALLAGPAALVLPVAATPPDADDVGPGLAGFVATFLLALVTILLLRNMVARLRRLQYRADAEERQRPDGDVGPGGDAGPGTGGGRGEPEGEQGSRDDTRGP